MGSSGFQLMPSGVAIMSGLDEGVWSWVTVNFLLRLVRSPAHSYGILDLGGGSVQITFVPSTPTGMTADPGNMVGELSGPN